MSDKTTASAATPTPKKRTSVSTAFMLRNEHADALAKLHSRINAQDLSEDERAAVETVAAQHAKQAAKRHQ